MSELDPGRVRNERCEIMLGSYDKCSTYLYKFFFAYAEVGSDHLQLRQLSALLVLVK